jgi:hemolysin activation/secretion protein
VLIKKKRTIIVRTDPMLQPLRAMLPIALGVSVIALCAPSFADDAGLIKVHQLPDILISQASPSNRLDSRPSTPANFTAQSSATFPVTAFDITGNNPMDQATTQKILASFIRSDATIDSLQQATAALDAELAARGFGLYRAVLPPQEIKDRVSITMIQFKIGQVNIEGNQNFSEANIRRALPELQSGATPDVALLSRQTALANESPARKLGVSLRASNQIDSIDATVRVNDGKPWWLTASISNTGSDETGKDRFTIAASHSNVWDRDHQVDIAYTTSLDKPSAVQQIGLNYKIPVYPWAGAWTFTASSATVKGDFGSFTTNGAGKSWGIGYLQHLGGEGGKRHFVSIRLDDKLSEASSVSGVVIGVDRRSRPLTLGYNLRVEADNYSWDLAANYAINVVSGAGNNDVTYALEDPARNLRARWRAARLNANLIVPFKNQWQISWRNQAQFSHQSLIAAEQIASGGTQWLRGSNGLTADKGWLSAVDISTPEFIKGLRGFVFLDAGYLSNHSPTLAKPASDIISTVGMGLRYSSSNDYGYVTKGSKIALTINSAAPKKGDDRLYLTLGWRY